MDMNQFITPYNKSISNRGIHDIKYIVIHYVGAMGDAKANCQYYAKTKVKASAHYFVGFSGDVWQSVEDKDIAWHCGSNSYKHPKCRNANSIGIEMCVRKKNTRSMRTEDKDWYFEQKTVDATVKLVKKLMKTYGIPLKNVVRHYDVTGKICPNPYVYNHTEYTWDSFKAALKSKDAKTGLKCRMYVKANPLKGKLNIVPKGSKVRHFKDIGSGWSYIEHYGIKGYLKNTCIKNIKNLSKYPTAKVTKSVYLRSKRKFGKAVRIRKLPVGTAIKVVGMKGIWAQVKVDGFTGFVVTSKIKLKKV